MIVSVVLFLQSLCEVIDKKGKVTFVGHRTIDNGHTINPSSETSLVCSRAKLDVIELWHRRL